MIRDTQPRGWGPGPRSAARPVPRRSGGPPGRTQRAPPPPCPVPFWQRSPVLPAPGGHGPHRSGTERVKELSPNKPSASHSPPPEGKRGFNSIWPKLYFICRRQTLTRRPCRKRLKAFITRRVRPFLTGLSPPGEGAPSARGSAGPCPPHGPPPSPSPPSSRSTAASPSRRPPSSSWRRGKRGRPPRSEPPARPRLRAVRQSPARRRRHLPRLPLTSGGGRGRTCRRHRPGCGRLHGNRGAGGAGPGREPAAPGPEAAPRRP